MAYVTAQRAQSSNTARYDRDRWNSYTVGSNVVYAATTPYWQGQGKGDLVKTWTQSTTEPTNP